VDYFSVAPKRQNAKLKSDVAALREENRILKIQVAEQAQTIETLKLQIEELRRMVFGKKRSGPESPNNTPPSSPKDRAPRNAASYRRPTPRQEEITETRAHPLAACPDCGSMLTHSRWSNATSKTSFRSPTGTRR